MKDYKRQINVIWEHENELLVALQDNLRLDGCPVSRGQHGRHPGVLRHHVHPLPPAQKLRGHVSWLTNFLAPRKNPQRENPERTNPEEEIKETSYD